MRLFERILGRLWPLTFCSYATSKMVKLRSELALPAVLAPLCGNAVLSARPRDCDDEDAIVSKRYYDFFGLSGNVLLLRTSGARRRDDGKGRGQSASAT